MELTLVKGPIYTSLRFTDVPHNIIAELLGVVRQVTSARPAGYKFVPSYKNKTWDGYIKLYANNKFPTGLMHRVVDAVTAAQPDLTINVVNAEDRFPECLPVLDDVRSDMFSGITLRDYQINAATTLLKAGRGVAKMATNSGKTEVIAAMCKALIGNILVLTTKKELLHQTSQRLSMRLDEPVGRVGDGINDRRRVTVAMIQTLCRHDNLDIEFGDVGCVMFDECHHVPSKTSQKVLMGIPAGLRFGFSGTPLHYDDLDDLVLIGATGSILVEVSNSDLIEAGVSSKPFVDMYVVDSADGFDMKYAKAYEKFIVSNDNRNNIIASCVGRQEAAATLVLVDRLEHGYILQRMIPGSLFANGNMCTDERSRILDKLRSGGGHVVIATPIFDEGVDVPSVDLLVLAAGGLTHIRLLQRVGRGMRQKESRMLRVVDFVDDTNKHLLRHSEARAQLYESEGFSVRVVE